MRFPKLNNKLVEVVSDLLQERLGPTADYVKSLISIECAYINTNHPDFPGAAGAMASLERHRKKSTHRQERKKMVRLCIPSPSRPRQDSLFIFSVRQITY